MHACTHAHAHTRTRTHTHTHLMWPILMIICALSMILTQYLHQLGRECDLCAVISISSGWRPFISKASLESGIINRVYCNTMVSNIKAMVKRYCVCPWCILHGVSMVYSAWCVHGVFCMVCPWCILHGVSMVYSAWCVHGVSMVYSAWYVHGVCVHGVFCTVCPWCIVHTQECKQIYEGARQSTIQFGGGHEGVCTGTMI